jgi:ribonuclease E
MSRQRIRFGVVESSTHKCPICDGTGLVRSTESLALMIMRHIEDHVLRKQGQSINVRVPVEVALYILNYKRETLSALEARNSLSITITADSKMTGHQFAIEKGEARIVSYADQRAAAHVRVDSAVIDDVVEEDEEVEADAEETEETEVRSDAAEGDGNGRRRRRRRRRGGRNGDAAPQQAAESTSEIAEDGAEDEDDEASAPAADGDADGEPRRRRRRGRRGGRRNRRDQNGEMTPEPTEAAVSAPIEAVVDHVPLDTASVEEPVAGEAPAEKPKRSRRKKVAETEESAPVETTPVEAVAEAEPDAPAEKPKRKPRARKPKAETAEAVADVAITEAAPEPAPVAEAAPVAEEAPARSRRVKKELPPEGVVVSSSAAPAEEAAAEGEAPKKKAGWWQRRLGLG